HKKTQGISRYVKFKYFFETILERESFQNDYESCLEEYAKLTRERVFAAAYTDGFEEFLRQCSQKLFIISGTPEIEVQKVIKHKEIESRFEMILGSPKTKYENLERIFEKHDLSKGLFIGDGKVDYQSANEYGLDFCFISNYSDMEDH
ncbi:MAG: HAD family hydrolase, partial [Bacteriovoracaceae bacterium]